jgi:hypothetical protein
MKKCNYLAGFNHKPYKDTRRQVLNFLVKLVSLVVHSMAFFQEVLNSYEKNSTFRQTEK